MKKIISLILIVTLFCMPTLSASAKDWGLVDELPDNAKVDDTARLGETYTYNEVKEMKLKFKELKTDVYSIIGFSSTTIGTVVGMIEKHLGESITVGTLANGLLIFAGLFLLDQAIGVQAVYRDIENHYEFYNDVLDEMNPGDTVQIYQQFEYRMWRFYGDRFWAWYENGGKSYDIN